MRILLFGVGLQGRAVLHDLENSPEVEEIVAADIDVRRTRDYAGGRGYRKTRILGLDAASAEAAERLMRETNPVVAISTLPRWAETVVARAAVSTGTHLVNTNYPGDIVDLDAEARRRGVMLLCEMGMDPGIDLVLARTAVLELDEVHGFRSYGAGFPDAQAAAANALHYKTTWTFRGVLSSYNRDARMLRDGVEVQVSRRDIFSESQIHLLRIPGVGELEAFPNGDAVRYAALLGIDTPKLREMGRYVLRWPGHCRFWHAMASLGLLDDTPVEIGGVTVTAPDFLAKLLEPRLRYDEGERDVVVIRVQAWGLRSGRMRRVVYELIDYRDPATGLFAMNRTVGFAASIGAQMIAGGEISGSGVLSPAADVPSQQFLAHLARRGIGYTSNAEPL